LPLATQKLLAKMGVAADGHIDQTEADSVVLPLRPDLADGELITSRS
jgi:hypothetical protein